MVPALFAAPRTNRRALSGSTLRRARRLTRAGMTLIEVMVVVVLVALVTTGVVVGSGQTGGAKLKRSAAMISGAVRIAMTRASITSKSQRIVFDLDEQKMWLEESSQPMMVSSLDKSATGGAEPVTAAEQAATKETERILKGPQAPKPRFSPVSGIGAEGRGGEKGPRPLESGITFRSIETIHDAEPRTSGRAYLYFWPGGQTERAVISLRIGKDGKDDQALSLLVAPLTGRVNIKPGVTPLVRPTDDKEASEREDTGGGL